MELALCMITRNDEVGVIQTLDSVRKLVTEMVVAVDASSTDNTKARAEAWLRDWDASGEKWRKSVV